MSVLLCCIVTFLYCSNHCHSIFRLSKKVFTIPHTLVIRHLSEYDHGLAVSRPVSQCIRLSVRWSVRLSLCLSIIVSATLLQQL